MHDSKWYHFVSDHNFRRNKKTAVKAEKQHSNVNILPVLSALSNQQRQMFNMFPQQSALC